MKGIRGVYSFNEGIIDSNTKLKLLRNRIRALNYKKDKIDYEISICLAEIKRISNNKAKG